MERTKRNYGVLERNRANELSKRLEKANKSVKELTEKLSRVETELTVQKACVAFSEQARKDDAIMYESKIRELETQLKKDPQ